VRLAPFLCRGFLLGYIPTPAGETRNEWEKRDASHDFIPLYYPTLLACILILSIYFTFSFFSKERKSIRILSALLLLCTRPPFALAVGETRNEWEKIDIAREKRVS